MRGKVTNLSDAKPAFLPPMKAKPVTRLPAGPGWLYGLKLDGDRALAIKTDGSVKLISRNRKDLTAKYPEIVEAVAALSFDDSTLDGEIVVLDTMGSHHSRRSRTPQVPAAALVPFTSTPSTC